MKTLNVFVGEGRARERSCRFSSRKEVRADFAKSPVALPGGNPMKTPNVFVGEGRARERSCRFSSRKEVRADFALT